MRIVLDANVVVAAFAGRGLCESILEVCLSEHEILLGEVLLAEISRNLARKVKLPPPITARIEALLRENGIVIQPAEVNRTACRDPGDLHVLGLAQAGQADFVITGDNDLLVLKEYGACRIVSPRDFAAVLRGR